MLSIQETAWIIYTIFFATISILLAARSRHHLLLIPFVLFGLLTSIALIVMLAGHYDILLESSWSDKSLVLNVLPVISLLVLLGIMEAQILFIRHVSAALYNRDRWRSIYMRDSEKPEGFPAGQESHPLRPWNYWASLVILAIYSVIVLCCILIQVLDSTSLGMPVCISLLWVLSTIDSFVVWKSSTFGNVRQNRDDLLFLRIVPLLFSLSMMGMCLLGWLHYAEADYSISVWILLESLFVYLPLLLVLVMCIHARKFKAMGRQYPNQHTQRLSREISFVTKRLTEEEVNSKYVRPPSSYYPH
ncbi:hypothetical protein CU098_011247 [Rhizopus stolonifer]|uniref:Transmembrane protein n=1 Tax=Rhizopus stolonifer TaxID=4846 RepID=A0A367KB03_RHIST|nr:hypothetical protein CU098_011247 [Rhizopus stolonifer]